MKHMSGVVHQLKKEREHVHKQLERIFESSASFIARLRNALRANTQIRDVIRSESYTTSLTEMKCPKCGKVFEAVKAHYGKACWVCSEANAVTSTWSCPRTAEKRYRRDA
jgi:hypothetical protein